ncbi:MAG: hypothetical protein PHV39_05290 [Methanomicrobium sp.]|nr:hypothetical protein [Methanomicrobium sp.]
MKYNFQKRFCAFLFVAKEPGQNHLFNSQHPFPKNQKPQQYFPMTLTHPNPITECSGNPTKTAGSSLCRWKKKERKKIEDIKPKPFI